MRNAVRLFLAIGIGIASLPPTASADVTETCAMAWGDASRAAFYVAASAICFLEVADRFWRVLHLALFLVTLVVSISLYECGGGSVWRRMIAASGPVTAIAHCARRRI